nr:zinc finger, CCHC-type [Tanacetum cinerariifolium]
MMMSEEDALYAFQHEYGNVETSKELWDTLETKYMAEDATSKKFLVSNFTNYKMTYLRPVLEQYNKLLGILGRFTQHKINMNESIQVSCIIDKNPPSWKDFKHTLKHLKEKLTLIELGSHLRIEESFRVHDSDKPKGNNIAGPSVVNMMEHNNSSRATVHVCKDRCWFKTYESLNDGSILHIGNESTALVHGRGCVDLSDLCNLHDTLSLGNKKYFATFIDDASRFCYVYLLHSKDEALDKFKVFKTKVKLQRKPLIKRFRTDRGETKPELPQSLRLRAAVRLPDPKLKTLDERGIECIFVGYAKHSKAFRFYVIEPNDLVSINYIIESREAIFDEHVFSSVPRPSQRSMVKGTEDSGGSNVAFWKEAITDEMDSIMGNNTWVLTDLPPVADLWVDLTKEFLSSRFSMKDIGEADVILGIKIKHESNVSTPLDTCEKLIPKRGLVVSQLEYFGLIGCLMYAMTCTRPDIAFAVEKLSRLVFSGYPSVLKGYIDASWISNTKDNSSTSGWVFLLGGSAIYWASKKQTCITGSIMESEFVALAADGKEAE